MRTSVESPHLVTVSRWFFTTIVASGFVGSEPGSTSDTLKSKGWKNCPGDKNIHTVSPATTIRDMATGLPRSMQRLDGVLSPGSRVTRLALCVAFSLHHVA